ncbi:MAG: fatty acyl-AMP ligase [Chloroflexi bacterium]|nr:fatty acyl-AMP ligase [Chloroflexota bacterium]
MTQSTRWHSASPRDEAILEPRRHPGVDELSTAQTLHGVIVDRATRHPNQLAMVFIENSGDHTQVSTQDLLDGSLRFGAALRDLGIEDRDLVILVMNHSLGLVYGFIGALMIGAIPSIFPDLTERLDTTPYLGNVRDKVARYGIRAVITVPEIKGELEELLADLNCEVLVAEEVLAQVGKVPDLIPVEADPLATAFIQYTSGTTGVPKGIALSHVATLNQVLSCYHAIEMQDDDVVVSWLPFYHDMGLIGSFWLPIVGEVPTVIMSPFKWVRSPKMLLHAFTQYRGTLCWMPNFAYNHSARFIRQRDLEGVDLSSWRLVLNGSEPVLESSHRIFVERFAQYGFRESALVTGYGMAENVLAISITPPHQRARIDWVDREKLHKERVAIPVEPGSDGAAEIVSNGPPVLGTQIRVVDETGSDLPERQVGQVIINSYCLFDGYYMQPELTDEVFEEAGWFRTGDLGYFANGELHVIGRAKDLIIVGGKNIQPQELESVANEIAGIRTDRSVAFGILDEKQGTDVVVMVCEVRGNPSDEERQAMKTELRRLIAERVKVTLGDVRLVQGRWLVKTTSGKVAREESRNKYLAEFGGLR